MCGRLFAGAGSCELVQGLASVLPPSALDPKGAVEKKHRTCDTAMERNVYFVENAGKAGPEDVRERFEFDEQCRAQEKLTGVDRAVPARYHVTVTFSCLRNIIKVFEYFEDDQNYGREPMRCCKGGELFDAILEQAIIMQQIFKAMVYMHENGVCHRDLKPENFLFLKKAPIKGHSAFGGFVQLQSRHVLPGMSQRPYYVAPEVLPRFPRYILLSGIFPFKEEGTTATLQKVRTAKCTFPPEAFQGVSRAAKELIKKLLQKSPEQRLSAKEALRDPWLTSSASLPTASLSSAVMENLRRYSAEHRFKKAALHVLARQQDDGTLSAPGGPVSRLRQVFTELDQDGDGIITFNELKEGLKNSGHDATFTSKELQHLARAVDADGSGEIDYTEFLAAAMERKAVVQESALWAAFRVFDKNDDGRISLKEIQEVLGTKEVNRTVSKEQIKKILAEVDTNGDGFIDFHEFIAMMRS
ncbi:CPK2 [Symbiodinium microadriaticum]|nr:CPK2 [Symbiodinium microadriaticum]